MKKIISIILAISMLLLVVPVSAESGTEIANLESQLIDETNTENENIEQNKVDEDSILEDETEIDEENTEIMTLSLGEEANEIQLMSETTTFASGDGSESNPYIITTEEELYLMANNLFAFYKLGNDIELTNDWTPIGTSSNQFRGGFDGDNFTISNIIVSTSGYAGFFANLGSGANIKNATFSVNITGSGSYTGGIAGYVSSGAIISDCKVIGQVTSTSGYIGGITGYDAGTITHSSSNATVINRSTNSSSYAGGLVGYIQDVTLENCYADGTVSGYYAGGLIGHTYYGKVQYCYATGNVSGTYAGGLIGYNSGYYSTSTNNYSTNVYNSYATGDIIGSSYAGGLIGYGQYKFTIQNCYSRGKATGGLLGGTSGYTVTVVSSYYDADTSSSTSTFGTGLSTNEMKTAESYKGWDFDSVWAISETENNGYPYLSLSGESVDYVIDGAGTASAPYLIKTQEDLIALATNRVSSSAYYRLENDITVTVKNWIPIGGNGYSSFTGVFDGNEHTINGVDLQNGYYEYAGLFGYLGNGAVIKDLTVDANISIVSTLSNSDKAAGIIAGYSNGASILNCTAKGTIKGYNGNTGGIVGYNNGTIENCLSEANVNGSGHNSGGITGYNNNVIRDSYVTGTVSGKNAGGIAGVNANGIVDCYATGIVTATSYAGGLIGSNSGTVTGCYATGTVTSSASSSSGCAGGLIGYHSETTLEGCYAEGDVSGYYAGGLIGQTYYGKVQYCYATGNISGTYAGGLIGYNSGIYNSTSNNYSTNVYNSYATGDVVGSSYAGGLIGYGQYKFTIQNCYSRGKATNGLLGASSYAATVVSSYYDADKNGNSSSYGAGLTKDNLKVKENFVDWDFVNIWGIDETRADGFPYLRFEYASELVDGVVLESMSEIIKIGGTVTLYASVRPLSAVNKALTWESSNTDVATVDENGVVYGISAGETTITVRSVEGNYIDTCTLTVIKGNELGDLNGDGIADSADAIVVLKATAGFIDLTWIQKDAADVTKDNEVDSVDALKILKFDAGLINSLD